MTQLAILLACLLCFLGFGVVVLVAGFLIWRSQQAGTATAPNSASEGGPTPALDAPVEPPPSVPSVASAELQPEAARVPPPPPQRAPRAEAEPEDFDEDEPTTLLQTSAEHLRTERLVVPPRPLAASEPTTAPDLPAAPPILPAPPPLPASHASPPPPSTRREVLEPPPMPAPQTLQPGATIIPPDDWNEDYIDDDELDATMLMVRPPLPPKK